MKDIKELQDFWTSHVEDEKMLCTIVHKRGSGYRGVGAKKIILKNGESCGYLSGGCLEGDIIRNALERWNDAPFIEEFSTMSEEDRLLGYQTGCAGVIDILFEPLPKDTQNMPLYLPFGKHATSGAVALSLLPNTLGQRKALDVYEEMEDHFVEKWIKPFHLFVIGCGPNAYPFAELAPPLGWEVTFLDYRRGNILPETRNVASKIVSMGDIATHVEEGSHSAVIVMTHNYEADLNIIGQLNGRNFAYVGSVGPRERFDQICKDSKTLFGVPIDSDWASNVHAPAGLKKARSPENIALSILAEIKFGSE